MFCTNCGSKLADGAKFCSECGARVVRPEEPVFRTNPDVQFEEPKVAEPTVEAPVYDEIPEKPVREKVSFDWSNVVDEPRRREVKEIKSPWGTTDSIDEKEIYAEMTPSAEKSRTMSFIDVLKAEKEEKERAAAEKAIRYTEVLNFDPDLTAFEEAPEVEEAPKLRMAPLYEDVDEPVKTPFDIPEEEKEPVFEDEPRFEYDTPKPEPEVQEPELAVPEAEIEIPETEPETPEVEFDEPEFEYEEPQRMAEAAEEPELKVSRETIAQFDEYVKSFEREAGIASEAAVEEPVAEAPKSEMPKFELPDFLKKVTDFASRKEEPAFAASAAEETEAEEPAAEEPSADEVLFEEPVIEETAEEPEFEEPVFEEPVVEEPAVEEPVFEEPVFEEPVVEEPVFEEPVFEEPAVEEPVAEEPVAEEPVVEEPVF